MAWNSTFPDGTKSVKANEATGQANTTYIETTLNNDHFWNIGADEDGRHKFAQMPKYEDGAVATPTSPTIAAGMDLAYFARLKTGTESVAQQDVQPYVRNDSAIMQLLGIRACGTFNVSGGVVTVVYAHNVSSVTRTATGRYTIAFDDAMPSSAYLFMGSAMRKTNDGTEDKLCNVCVASSSALDTTKTTTEVHILCSDMSANKIDPLQLYFVVFGG